MSKPDTNAPSSSAPPSTLGQADLVALGVAESLRRVQARAALGVGAWAHVHDQKTADAIGEEVVQISAVEGNARAVVAFFNRSVTRVEASKLRPCLASGDKFKTSTGHTGIVLDVNARRPGEARAWAVSPRWGIDSSKPDAFEEHSVDLLAVNSALTGDFSSMGTHAITPRAASLDKPAHCVRGWLSPPSGADADGIAVGVGPNLPAIDFLRVAGFAEPCRVRKDASGKIVDDTVYGCRAVLCDFHGGATLWVWAAVLVEFTMIVEWKDSPSYKHHPKTHRIRKPSADVAARAAAATPPPSPPIELNELEPLPALDSVPALAEGNPMTDYDINKLCISAPARGTILVLDETYARRLRAVVDSMKDDWGVTLADAADEFGELIVDAEHSPPGAYEVRKNAEIELPDGKLLTVSHCSQVGVAGAARRAYLCGLLQPAGTGQALALREPDGVVARVSKAAGSKALEVAKDAFQGAKDLAIEEGKRKATAFAQVATQDSLVAGYEAARRTALAAGAALMGADNPEGAATSTALAQGFDMATIAGGKLLARMLERHAPGTAKIISAATETLQDGIDRKQAKSMLDQAAPMIGGGLLALAQAGVKKFMPALAAGVPTPALPVAPVEPPAPAPTIAAAPTEKPKRKRTPKPKSDGGAK